MRVHLSVALALVFLSAGCFEEPSYEGRRCFANEPCPSGFACGVDERCYKDDGSDAGVPDAGSVDASSVDPARCTEPARYPLVGWEARYYLLPNDPAIEDVNCFGVEMIDGVELHKDFMFEGPTPEILTFASRYTGQRTLAGALELRIFHDDGFRLFANELSLYDHWEGPTRVAVFVEHYFPRGSYAMRADHYDVAGEADIQVGWRSVCADVATPVSGWALAFHRLDPGGAIDVEDCFGIATVASSTIALSYSEAPGTVRDTGTSDRYAIVARAKRTFNGATTFAIAHDDGLRLYYGTTLLYEDLTPGAKRTAMINATLNGEHELTLEAHDFTGAVDATLTW